MRRYLLPAALALTIFLADDAFPFGTINGLGQKQEHERITRRALACAATRPVADCFEPDSIDNLAGKAGTFGAVGAPDNPTRGLLINSAAHCDNGDFLPIPGYANTRAAATLALVGCRRWMDTHMNAAVTEAAAMLLPDGTVDDSQMPTFFSCTFTGVRGRAKCNVLEEFGLVLHASQDFYAHTNWTDVANPRLPISQANPPGLGASVPAPWLDLRVPSPALPTALISGCFVMLPEAVFCNSGPGGRVKHHFLNKDKGTIDPSITVGTTPRGEVMGNFGRSVEVAIADTRDKWLILKERLIARYGVRDGSTMICALTHDDPARTCVSQGQGVTSVVRSLGWLAIGLIGLAGLGYFALGGRQSRDGGLKPV